MTDIPLLAKHFLEEVCEESGRKVTGFSDEALAALQRYRWPGNVRELQNVVERAVLLGKGDVITVDDLPPQLAAEAPISAHADPRPRTLKEALEGPERQIILEVLESNNWNRHATADELGINRTTLYKKMKRLGLEDERFARRWSGYFSGATAGSVSSALRGDFPPVLCCGKVSRPCHRPDRRSPARPIETFSRPDVRGQKSRATRPTDRVSERRGHRVDESLRDSITSSPQTLTVENCARLTRPPTYFGVVDAGYCRLRALRDSVVIFRRYPTNTVGLCSMQSPAAIRRTHHFAG